MKRILSIIAAGFLLGFVSCKKSDPAPAGPTYTAPTLTTNAVTNITANSATSGGTISNDGGTPVTTRGVAWYTVSNYPFSNCYQTTDGFLGSTYTSTMTALLPHTTYYVRAYAANGKGYYGFGQEISFTTP